MYSEKSIVTQELLRKTLTRGALFAIPGAFLLFFSKAPLIFPLSLIMIAMGIVPYRKLQRLQIKPHEIHLDETHFTFCKSGKPLFKIERDSIASIEFDKGLYLSLKEPKKITLFGPKRHFRSFCTRSGRIFLPHFSAKLETDRTSYNQP